MIEKIAHIKNPLTVIGAFAGLAEVSGTCVLPFLQPDVQYTFVWFLMLFPTGLVLLFFATLIFRHYVLYAPSDYSDPSSFERVFQQSKREVLIDKIAETAREDEKNGDEDDEINKSHVTMYEADTDDGDVPTFEATLSGTSATPFIAERLIIAKLAEDRGISFVESVSPAQMPDIAFDAVSVTKTGLTVVETKYYRKSGPSLKTAQRDLARMTAFLASLERRPRSVKFIWAIAVDFRLDDVRVHNIRRTLNRASLNMPFEVEVVIYDFDTLALRRR